MSEAPQGDTTLKFTVSRVSRGGEPLDGLQLCIPRVGFRSCDTILCPFVGLIPVCHLPFPSDDELYIYINDVPIWLALQHLLNSITHVEASQWLLQGPPFFCKQCTVKKRMFWGVWYFTIGAVFVLDDPESLQVWSKLSMPAQELSKLKREKAMSSIYPRVDKRY